MTEEQKPVKKVKSVTDIDFVRKQKADKKAKEDAAKLEQKYNPDGVDKPKKIDVFNLYAKALDGCRAWDLPDIKERYMVVKAANGLRRIVTVGENKVCRYVEDFEVVSTILIFWETYANDVPSFWLDVKGAESCVSYWKMRASAVAEPAAFAWADEDIYCFSKLPFTYEKGAACPEIFAEFLSRMTNSLALCQFIGSLFYPDSDRQQYVWMYGEGNNGKGAFANFLYSVFGASYEALTVPHNRDSSGLKFMSGQLPGKRLGVFAEVNNPSFVTSAIFKQWTGNEPSTIEGKYGRIFTTKLTIKFLMLSNSIPALSSERADMRRIIFCELQEIVGDTIAQVDFDAAMWAAARGILSFCRDRYEEHVALHSHSPLTVDKESAAILTQDETEQYESVLDRNFDMSSPSFYCLGKDFGLVMKREFGGQSGGAKAFRQWLKRTHKIESKPRAGVGRVYQGMKIKAAPVLVSPGSEWWKF